MRFHTARLIGRIAGACAVLTSLLAAKSTLLLFRGMDPPSILTPFLAGSVATWTLLLVGGVGLLYRRPWAFALIYLATGLNYYAGLSFIPLLQPAIASIIAWHSAGPIAVQAVNLILVALLVRAHLVICRGPANDA